MTTESERKARQELYRSVTSERTRWHLWHGTKSRARGRVVQLWTAQEIWDMIPEGGCQVVYGSFKRGPVEGFSRSVAVRGDCRIDFIDGSGNTVWAMPLGTGRTMRILVQPLTV